MSVLQLAVEKLSDSVIGYFHLWRYLDALLQHRLAGARTHVPASCAELWTAVAEGSVKHGDRVRLDNFFVTEWLPRLPGAVHAALQQGELARDDYEALPTLYHSRSTILTEGTDAPPFGSVRLPVEHRKRIALGAVSASDYHVDLGVVLSVGHSVYREFLSKQRKGNAVEANIEGYVEMFEPPRDLPDLSTYSTKGSFVRPPTFVISVESPLQTRFRAHSSHPILNAWAVRRMEHLQFQREFDFFFVSCGNRTEELRHARHLARSPITCTEVESWVDEFARSPAEFLKSVGMPSIDSPDVKLFECVTEFDSRVARLDPLIPIGTDPRADAALTDLASTIVAEMRNVETEHALRKYHRHTFVANAPVYTWKCGHGEGQVKFQPYASRFGPRLDDCQPFPADDRMTCPHCGGFVDLTESRIMIEKKHGRPIPRC